MIRLTTRHALRDMRASQRHLRLFFFVLLLGITVMAAVGSVVEGIKTAITRDARGLLGGDIEIRQFYRPISLAAETFLSFNSTRISRVLDMRAMAQVGDQNILVELKAVDVFYPLYGKMRYAKELTPAQKIEKLKQAKNISPADAMVDQSLLDMLGIELGGIFKIGKASFMAVAVIESEPDRGFSTFSLGPRVLTYRRHLKDTGLLQNGTMVNYRYRILLPKGETPDSFKQKMKAQFPDAAWNLRDWNDSAPGLVSLIDRLSLFFALSGITALVVAGIGISGATSAYMWSKRNTIAALKCLGASQRHIYQMYLMQILLVSALAIAGGCAAGILVEMALSDVLKDLLTVKAEKGIYLRPLALSAALGIVTVLIFTFIPLIRSTEVKPKALLRGHLEQPAFNDWTNPYLLVLLSTLVSFLLVLTVMFTGNAKITLYFFIGLGISMLLLYALGRGLQRLSKQQAHNGKHGITLSMALANLARPGANTVSIVIALGIGISLMVTLTLVGANLRAQVERGLPEHAPAFFLADIQPSDLEELEKKMRAVEGVKEITHLPIIRGRITKLNGKDPEEVEIAENARWGIRSERGLTTAAMPPANSSITEGAWWSKDYKGPPLVSFDAALARGMGLKLGNTITISAMDKKITATIANLRDIEWGTLEMNFAIILSPGALDGLPTTYIATINAPLGAEKSIQKLLADQYPSVAVVRVREVLNRVSGLLNNVSLAVMVTALITVICSILVMAGAIHASMHKRVFDTVMLKVLGAVKSRILAIYLLEFSLIAIIVSAIAVLIGLIGAYGIMQLMIFSKFAPMPSVIITTIGISLVLAILLGLAATRGALKVRPLSLLRNE